ncbi:Anaphase-promoting complex subunit 4 [Zea mays]|uniref:Anaphase-promoting complex subunit 4 n=1 Tax=Zea mays TaxID=4577 RepID=A0A1D6NT75_MAIZE|nr:Anaphase-promoting complex subunit 4 [Zea mays]
MATAAATPFQLQFDKPIPFQIKMAEWNPEKDLLAMVTDDSKDHLITYSWGSCSHCLNICADSQDLTLP